MYTFKQENTDDIVLYCISFYVIFYCIISYYILAQRPARSLPDKTPSDLEQLAKRGPDRNRVRQRGQLGAFDGVMLLLHGFSPVFKLLERLGYT